PLKVWVDLPRPERGGNPCVRETPEEDIADVEAALSVRAAAVADARRVPVEQIGGAGFDLVPAVAERGRPANRGILDADEFHCRLRRKHFCAYPQDVLHRRSVVPRPAAAAPRA